MRTGVACLLAALATFTALAASDTKPPTVPRSLSVTGVTATSVSLSWQASTDFKGGSGVAGYDILRNGTFAGSVAAPEVAYTDTGLAQQTTYQYTVRARDKAGNVSVPSTPVSATTSAGTGCSALPPVPGAVTVTSVSSSTVTLSWSGGAAPENCVVTFNVFRNGTRIAEGLPTETYIATGLTPDSSYEFSVSATDSIGSSALSTPIPATTDSAGGDSPGFPSKVFAPYVDVLLWPTPSLSGMATQSGSKYFSAGFIVAGSGCEATWGRHYPMSEDFLQSDIAALREMGGDVIASFGGAAGTELALACSTVEALQAQYQSVIDTYGFTRLDFDIEGSALGNAAANDRRALAILGLQAAAAEAGRTLTIQFTLPVMPWGLTPDGEALLRNAIGHGVDIGVVNVMAMDYGRSYDPYQMGTHAVTAMNETIRQMKTLYGSGKSDDLVRAMVGVTPMIGLNDVSPEVFTMGDADTLLTAANIAGIGFLSFWSAPRDQPCARRQVVSPTCSGIPQEAGAFTAIFAPFTLK